MSICIPSLQAFTLWPFALAIFFVFILHLHLHHHLLLLLLLPPHLHFYDTLILSPASDYFKTDPVTSKSRRGGSPNIVTRRRNLEPGMIQLGTRYRWKRLRCKGNQVGTGKASISIGKRIEILGRISLLKVRQAPEFPLSCFEIDAIYLAPLPPSPSFQNAGI